MKLNPEQARAKLVGALRSEEYKQTSGALRDADGYCCLGVACDLYRKTEDPERDWVLVDAKSVIDQDKLDEHWEFLNTNDLLPQEVMEWLGFATRKGDLHDGRSALSTLNDQGEGFEYIADVIEDGAVELKERGGSPR